MRLIKKILLAIVIVAVLIQFIQPAHNKSVQETQMEITKLYSMPVTVQNILKNVCYDCHSNHTRYPWYVHIQPMGWLMAKHIKEGKDELNFDEFGSYSLRRKESKLRSIASSIDKETMPLQSYTLMHADARLTENEKAIIIDWATKTKDSLTTIK
jgi:competence CoiA-like predicted nuclease